MNHLIAFGGVTLSKQPDGTWTAEFTQKVSIPGSTAREAFRRLLEQHPLIARELTEHHFEEVMFLFGPRDEQEAIEQFACALGGEACLC